MLKEYGITSLVEDISPTDLVKKYNEDYPSTYTHSKENLINAKNKYNISVLLMLKISPTK